MAETPILRLPIPDGGSVADGPDAIGDLALAVEAKMPSYQGVIYDLETEAEVHIRPGETQTVVVGKVSSTVNGWIELEWDLGIAADDTNGNQGWAEKRNYAGLIIASIAGTRLRAQRYHSQNQSQYVLLSGRVRRNTTGRVTTDILLQVSADLYSGPVQVVNSNAVVHQFGSQVT